MKIGILSDTHNMLRPEVLEALQGCDLILHAGDIAKPEILDKLRQIAPIKVVRGNNDRAWAEDLPMHTLMLMELGDGQPVVRKVEIEHKLRKMNTPPPSDLNLIIIGAVRDIQKGLSVAEIAGKYNISEDFAEQICRMYLTHPGIDAQGVINKMELYSRGL